MSVRDERAIARDVDRLFNLGTLAGLNEAELIERFVARRDEAALGALVTRHAPMVLGVCRRVLRNEHDIEDAFQATFLVFVRRAREIRDAALVGNWLHGVAHRVAVRARAVAAQRHQREHTGAQRLAESCPTDEQKHRDLRAVLDEELGRLPASLRAPVVLCYLEGMTHDEAAERLRWPVGTVRSRMARARARLRERLQNRGLVVTGSAVTASFAAEPVSALLIDQAVRASVEFATERAAGLASATALAKGVLHTMAITRLRFLVAATLVSMVAAVGGVRALALQFDGLVGNQKAAGAEPDSAGQQPGAGNPGALKAEEPPITRDVAAAERKSHAVCLAISPDGKSLAAGCSDKSVYLLDAETGEKRVTLTGTERGYIRSVAFMPGGKAVATVGDDNRLRLWDVESGNLVKALPALDDLEPVGLRRPWVTALAVSPDGKRIAVGGYGTMDPKSVIRGDDTTFFQIRVFDGNLAELAWSRAGRGSSMYQLAFSPDGKTLAHATGDLRLWDAETGNLRQTLKPQTGHMWALAFSPDNRLVAGFGTATIDERKASWLTVWDLRSGDIVHSLDAGEAGGVAVPGTLAFAPDGRTLASPAFGSMEKRSTFGGKEVVLSWKRINHIKLWDVATGQLLWTSAAGELGHLNAVVFSPTGRSLFCCDGAATSRIDAQTGQTRKDLMKVENASASRVAP